MPTLRPLAFLLPLALASLAFQAQAQDSCSYRGPDMDTLYCDTNRDMLADPPTDPKKLRNPNTVIFTFTPAEDTSVYEKLLRPFTEYLSQCIDKKIVYFQVQSNAAEIEAMRSGRLHIGSFSTGPTPYAVNIAGAQPFAIMGDEKNILGYQLVMVVKKDSPYQKLPDLKGKRVAHSSPSSNSGHLAPLALFPAQGLTPGKDYDITFSGKHDQSVLRVARGDYDAAAVPHDIVQNLHDRGQLNKDDFRTIYTSATFPTNAFALPHDLDPALGSKIKTCFYDYRFNDELKKHYPGADRFLPVNYQRDWEVVRQVSEAAGVKYNRAAYEKENAKK